MGKGKIISEIGDGEYNVQLTFHREHYEARIAKLTARIIEVQTAIGAEPAGEQKENLKLLKKSYEKRKEVLENNMPEDATVSAWCADASTGIEGYVGTIEIAGERTNGVNIYPGYISPAWVAEYDGHLQPAIAGKPFNTLLNWCLFPAWQKHIPIYRYGTITAITGNECDVTLHAATSSQQGIDVNKHTTLSDVPIFYMSCHGAVFSVDDEVVIEFQTRDWENPWVIGFKDNPVSCDFDEYLILGLRKNAVEAQTYCIVWDLVNKKMASVTADSPKTLAELADFISGTVELSATNYIWPPTGDVVEGEELFEPTLIAGWQGGSYPSTVSNKSSIVNSFSYGSELLDVYSRLIKYQIPWVHMCEGENHYTNNDKNYHCNAAAGDWLYIDKGSSYSYLRSTILNGMAGTAAEGLQNQIRFEHSQISSGYRLITASGHHATYNPYFPFNYLCDTWNDGATWSAGGSISKDIIIHTPFGQSDPLEYYRRVGSSTGYSGEDYSDSIAMYPFGFYDRRSAFYTPKSAIQIYIFNIGQYDDVNVERSNIRVIHAATEYRQEGDAEDYINPNEMVRHPGLETAIGNLMDWYIANCLDGYEPVISEEGYEGDDYDIALTTSYTAIRGIST